MNNGPEHMNATAGTVVDSWQEAQLEAALRDALRPVDAPSDFADRAVRRALAGHAPVGPVAVRPGLAAAGSAERRLLHLPARRFWAQAAVAAALVLGLFEGSLSYRRVREEQRRIAEATAQFQTTERVTMHALAQAREQLQRAGVPLNFD